MTNQNQSATILDVSRGLGYGLLYHPVIGKKTQKHYPFIVRFQMPSPFHRYSK